MYFVTDAPDPDWLIGYLNYLYACLGSIKYHFMKFCFWVCCFVALSAVSCKKDKENIAPDTSAFYFRGTLNGKAYSFAGADKIQVLFNTRLSGGKAGQSAHVPVAAVAFDFGKKISDADAKGINGHTYNFINLSVFPSVDIYDENAATYYSSVDTTNGSYNVKVRSVAYVRTDTISQKPVDVYVVNGTCNAVMVNDKTGKLTLLKDASFNLLMGRIK